MALLALGEFHLVSGPHLLHYLAVQLVPERPQLYWRKVALQLEEQVHAAPESQMLLMVHCGVPVLTPSDLVIELDPFALSQELPTLERELLILRDSGRLLAPAQVWQEAVHVHPAGAMETWDTLPLELFKGPKRDSERRRGGCH
jgi:hypothetical protein